MPHRGQSPSVRISKAAVGIFFFAICGVREHAHELLLMAGCSAFLALSDDAAYCGKSWIAGAMRHLPSHRSSDHCPSIIDFGQLINSITFSTFSSTSHQLSSILSSAAQSFLHFGFSSSPHAVVHQRDTPGLSALHSHLSHHCPSRLPIVVISSQSTG